MGCDIHGCYEVYRDVFGEDDSDRPIADWMAAEEIAKGRYYSAWAEMAGVRGRYDDPPPTARRGIPDNACCHNRDAHEADGADAHSATWLTLPEMRQLGEVAAPYVKRMEKLRDFYGVKDEHIRIVCWFDN